MNYHPDKRSRSEQRDIKKIASICVGLLILFLIIYTNTFSSSDAISNTGSIIWNIRDFWGEKVDNFFTLWLSKNNLVEENRKLRDTIKSNEIAIIQNKLLQKENSELRKLMGETPSATTTLLATILVKPPQTSYDTLIVSVGKDKNIEIGEKVYAYDNIYIGKITDVFANSSKVTLFSTPGEKWNVSVGGNDITTVAKGMGLGNYLIELPRAAEIRKNDYVTFANSSDILGRVYAIQSAESDSFQKIFVHSDFNISELKWITIKK
jgi:cell shape-determining protein MreC